MRPFDPIALLEAFYVTVDSTEEWFDNVLQALCVPFDGSRSLAGYRVNLRNYGLTDIRCTDRSVLPQWEALVAAGAGDPNRQSEVRQADPMGLYTNSEVFSDYEKLFGEDCLALAAPDGEEHILVFCAPLAQRFQVPNDMRPIWRKIAAHLGAGSRLNGRSHLIDDVAVEAIMEPSGKLLHARGSAKDRDTQEKLRKLTGRIDKVRTVAGRKDPSALDLWTGLILGNWSIVDHFDTDGRRLSVARRNDPNRPEMGGLSRRERQVAFYAALGLSNKHIGYSLGLAESTVATHIAKILVKLQLQRRGDLIEFAAKSSEQSTKRIQAEAAREEAEE